MKFHDRDLRLDGCMTLPKERTPKPVATSFSVPWPALSITLAIIAVVCLGTLAVVVSVKDVDILSTVALAIAILSFAAQLIVSILQTESSSKLNGETESALAELRATTESLLTNQRDQFDTVLRAALSVVPAAVEDVAAAEDGSEDGPVDAAAASEALQESLQARLRQILERSYSVTSPAFPATAQGTSLLDEYPAEEAGTAAVPLLRTISPLSIPVFLRFAQRVRSAEKAGLPTRIRYTSSNGAPGKSFQELLDKGLLAENERSDSHVFYEMTPEGMTVARLITPTKTRPEWLKRLV